VNTTPIEKVLAALSALDCKCKRCGDGYQAQCPAHEDRNPSLSVRSATDATLLLKCRAGCSTERIVSALGLKLPDLFPRVDVDTTSRNAKKTAVSSTAKGKRRTFPAAAKAVADLERRLGQLSATWTYHDAEGHPVGVVIRWEKDSGKNIRPVAKINGDWVQAGMPSPRPLFRLPELLQSTGPAFVVEGEKCADALHALGFVATTSAHGAKSAKGSDWSPLAGREVVILPDNDEAGAGYAESVSDHLSKLTPTPRIKIVNLSGLPAGGDVVDFIADRKQAAKSDETIHAEIQTMADNAEAVQQESSAPEALEYQPFPVDLLPEPINGYVRASAVAIGCDAAFVALPILAAIALAIGNSRLIRLKRRWTEPAILWLLTIATSGGHKSPGFDAAMLPIRKRQEKSKRRFTEQMKRYEIELEEHKQKLAEWKEAGAVDPRPEKPEKPIWERCWTDDTTIEALASLLLQNPRGLLLSSDELSAWLASFDRYAKAGTKTSADAARWLHVHGGRAIVIDRKTGEPRTIFVPHATVSVAGSIQPGVLRRALSREHHENGMAARFLFAMPPKRQKRWTEAEIDQALEADVLALFERLFDLRSVTDDDGEPIPKLLNLSTAAKHEVWIPFYNEHGKEQIELDDDLSAAWSKLEGYAARLALVHHLIRVAANDDAVADPDTVDEVSMAAGIALSRWFGEEAKRVYAMLSEDEDAQQIRELVELVERLGGVVRVRDLQRHSRKYRESHVAENALQLLVNQGKGAWQANRTGAQGGAPTRAFVLRRVDTTPAKLKKNAGSVNVNGEEQTGEPGDNGTIAPPPPADDADDWGEA
jgi:Protein of unknown function (DUF3987)